MSFIWCFLYLKITDFLPSAEFWKIYMKIILEKLSGGYKLDLSFNRKTFRVQIAVDFQVSPKAVYIMVSTEITAEVVSNTCGDKWML